MSFHTTRLKVLGPSFVRNCYLCAPSKLSTAADLQHQNNQTHDLVHAGFLQRAQQQPHNLWSTSCCHFHDVCAHQ